jgi:hypothetical protein
MMKIDRSNVVLVIVVVAALAVASVVAAHGHGGATALSTTGTDNPSVTGLADTSALASSTGSAATTADPAKQQPTLDQFHSRDPFIQATAAASAASSGSTSPTAAPTAEATPVAADIKLTTEAKSGNVSATYNDEKVGDQIPPAGAIVQIKAITANAVTFKLLNDYTIGGDSTTDTFDVAVDSPTSVTLEKNSAKTTYIIDVLQVIYSSGSGSGSSSSSSSSSSSVSSSTGSTLSGHTIKALSIETANGVPAATLVVDGHTYAARKVGSVISTSWGQIKVVGINGPAQTVTILHGDVQVTIRVGDTVNK